MADKDIKNEEDVMVMGSENEEKPEVKGMSEASASEEVKEEKEEEDVKPKVHLSADTDNDDGPNETELNDDKKSKLVQDVSWICSVDVARARGMLEANKWDMQVFLFFKEGIGKDM